MKKWFIRIITFPIIGPLMLCFWFGWFIGWCFLEVLKAWELDREGQP